jgi:hypothetical protein
LTYAQYAEALGWTPWKVDNEVYGWLEPLLIPLINLIREVRDG